ncbi:MAG: cytochrome b [Acidocella sp.]|nr:cytochrome b [Acidocella sp.]
MSAVEKYTRTAVVLHWLIALLVGLNILLAITTDYFPDTYVRPMLDLHKSIGITMLGLVALRILWRLTHRPPPLPADYKPWEVLLANTAHYALYVLIIAMPLTGWTSDSGWKGAPSHPMMLFWIIPWFRFGFITSMDAAHQKYIHDLFGNIHTLLSYCLYGVLGLHVLGALKHQFIDRHPAIQRMWK